MAQHPFGFNISLDGSTEQRYIALPFDARAISEREALVLLSRQDRMLRLPTDYAHLLGRCDRFRSLDDQAVHVTSALGLPSDQTQAVRQALEQLVHQGLMQSEDQLHARLTGTEADPVDGGIETLFVRTRARPDTLGRLIESLQQGPAPRHLKHCVVLDDDPDAESAAKTRAVIDGLSAQSGPDLVLIDRQRRGELLDRIAAASDVEPRDLAWLIEGDHDDPLPGYGASLNLALLLAAGNRFAIMDDDAVLSAFRLESADDSVGFCGGHQVRTVFPDASRALPEQFEPLEGNPLDVHARWLGTAGAELAQAGSGDLRALFGNVDPQVLHDLSRPTRVRVTSNGTLGDPGTSGVHWLLAEPPAHLEPLLQSEQAYRQILTSRSAARSVEQIQAATAFSLMTTTLTGIDNRELLLPTQARGPNEDLLFGALVSFLHPGALHVALPHMLYHMRSQPRTWNSEAFKQPRNTNRGRFLAARVEQLASQTPGQDSDSRMRVLGDWLDNLGSLSLKDMQWQLQRDLLDLRSRMLERLGQTRRELDPPAWLAADLDASIEAHATVSASDYQQLETLADGLPAFARRYAGAIETWCSAWRHCSATDIDQWLEA